MIRPRSLHVLLLIVLSLTCGCGDNSNCDAGATLELRQDDGELLARIQCAEVASTAAERATGLIGRSGLAAHEALLLSFPLEGDVCISNEDVTFPIEAYFVNEAGHVVEQHSFASMDPDILCRESIKWVLEVAKDALSIDVQNVRLVILSSPP